MAYKSILTVVTDVAHLNATISQAVSLAQETDAHLDVMCLGVDATQAGYYYAGMSAAILQDTLAQAQEVAESLASKSRELLNGTSLRWCVTHGICPLSDISRQVANHARFADLVILPKPYGEQRGLELEPVVEGALFEGQSPVLVLPDATAALKMPHKIAIGWNESSEALRAVRAALPMLKAAQTVHVVVVDPPQHGPNRSDPGGQLSQYLARHGLRIEIDVLSKTLPRVSDIMRRHATDIQADLIVMGAYGHSRFREAILGGATRNMLETADIPVFMAH